MRITKLRMRNWCQFTDKTIELHAGMNAFVGENGSGKSNSMNAMVFALTGDYSRNDGSKTENICQFAPQKEQAFVELFFTHNYVHCHVIRGLRGRQSTLRIYNDADETLENIKGDKSVTVRIQELLDTNAQIINEYVFVGQGKLFAPFEADVKPSDRKIAFQRFFGLDRLEEVWEAFGEHLSAIPRISVPDYAGWVSQYEALKRDESGLLTQLADYADLESWSLNDDPDAQLIARYNNGIAQRYATQASRATLKTLLSQRRRERNDLVACQHRLDEATNTQARLADRYAQAKQAVLQHQQSQAVLEQQTRAQYQYEQCREALQSARTQRDALLAILTSYEFQDLPTIDSFITNIKAELLHLAQTRTRLSSVGDASECPTCGQRVSQRNVSEQIQNLSDRMAVQNEQHDALVQRRRDLNRLLVEINALDNVIEQRDAESTQLLETLNRFATSPGVLSEVERTNYNDFIRIYDDLIVFISSTTNELTFIRNNAQATVERVQNAYTTYSNQRKQLGDIPTEATKQYAEQRLINKQRRFGERLALVNCYSGIRGQLDILSNQIQEARKLEDSAQVNEDVRQIISTLRDKFHRDKLPQELMTFYLGELQHLMNEMLELSETQFRVAASDIGYNAHFFDGRIMPLTRLSGGLKVLTALTFRIASNSKFAHRIGVLGLDEPTVYLDKKNMEFLPTALAILRKFSEANGLQCIVNTHDNVRYLFDHVENFS